MATKLVWDRIWHRFNAVEVPDDISESNTVFSANQGGVPGPIIELIRVRDQLLANAAQNTDPHKAAQFSHSINTLNKRINALAKKFHYGMGELGEMPSLSTAALWAGAAFILWKMLKK